MEDTKLPPTQTTQPASPDAPQFDTPKSFPTPAHPMPTRLPKWLGILLLFIIIGFFIFMGYQLITGISFSSENHDIKLPPLHVPTTDPIPTNNEDRSGLDGAFCSGVVPCAEGYQCQLDNPEVPSGGRCIKR